MWYMGVSVIVGENSYQHNCQQKTPSETEDFNTSIFIQVRKEFHGENDRVKLIVLYCGIEDDVKLVRAASGALATLTYDTVVCHKVMTVSFFLWIRATCESCICWDVVSVLRPILEISRVS